jgi:hypothetical protein
MATVVNAHAVISAKNNMSPGLAAAAKELDKFHAKQSRMTKAQTTQTDRLRSSYADIASKVQSFSAALDGIASKRSLSAMTGHIASIRKDIAAAEKIDAFRSASRRLDDMAMAMKSARQEAAKAKGAIGTGRGTVEAHERAGRALDRATKAFREQGVAARSARADLAAAGIAVNSLAASEANLKRSIEGATAAMQKQAAAQARSAARREGVGALAGAAGISAGIAGKNIGRKAVVSIADFDIAVRKQREFTDISAADQNSLLIPQAKRIGQETQFSNLDIVKAQTAAMQGLPSNITGTLKAEVAQGLIENAKHYALIMESGMATAAEAMRSYLQTTGQDISTKEKALAAANKATNQLVRMAKDVVGEWVPVPQGEEPTGIVLRGRRGKGWRRWCNGLTWSDLANDLVISKETTKTGALVSHDLKLLPTVTALLDMVPQERRIGALIVNETARRPYAEFAYARDWREIARKVGIPDTVWNMDARAGAITEAEDAGADLDTIRGSVGHTQASTTARYSRGAIGKSRTIAGLRSAHRDGENEG